MSVERPTIEAGRMHARPPAGLRSGGPAMMATC